MSEYKRLTERDEYGNADIIGLSTEKLFGELYFDEINLLTKVLNKLAFLEDKIENGTLIELPCKVGDTAMAIIDTLAYDNSLQRVKIEGLAYIVKDENGDITFQHINRLFSNEAEAEARLKELQEEQK